MRMWVTVGTVEHNHSWFLQTLDFPYLNRRSLTFSGKLWFVRRVKLEKTIRNKGEEKKLLCL